MRRASARNALGKHRGAYQDLSKCLDIINNDCNNADYRVINNELQKTKELLRNAVNLSAMINIKTVWSNNNDDETDNIPIESGPDFQPIE